MDRNLKMFIMRESGMEYEEIAKEFEISKQRVHQVLVNIYKTSAPQTAVCPVCKIEFVKRNNKQVLCNRCIVIRHSRVGDLEDALQKLEAAEHSVHPTLLKPAPLEALSTPEHSAKSRKVTKPAQRR